MPLCVHAVIFDRCHGYYHAAHTLVMRSCIRRPRLCMRFQSSRHSAKYMLVPVGFPHLEQTLKKLYRIMSYQRAKLCGGGVAARRLCIARESVKEHFYAKALAVVFPRLGLVWVIQLLAWHPQSVVTEKRVSQRTRKKQCKKSRVCA